jgi:hypothetical protein
MEPPKFDAGSDHLEAANEWKAKLRRSFTAGCVIGWTGTCHRQNHLAMLRGRLTVVQPRRRAYLRKRQAAADLPCRIRPHALPPFLIAAEDFKRHHLNGHDAPLRRLRLLVPFKAKERINTGSSEKVQEARDESEFD